MVLFNPQLEDKGVTLPNAISPKVNVIAWVEFELAYFEATVQHFNYYAAGFTPNLMVPFLYQDTYCLFMEQYLYFLICYDSFV